MAQFSMLWETVTATGDGVNTYTEDNAGFFFRDFSNAVPASMGILSGIDNEMAVSGSASPLAVATGKALVYQFRYMNDASVNLAVPTPVGGDTGGRIVIRADWALNTVRLYTKLNTDGNPAIPALTQTPGTSWEIGLASFVIDTAGAIWTTSAKTVAGVTDTRSFALSPLAGMVRLRTAVATGASGVITWQGIQQDLSHLLIIGQARDSSANLYRSLALMFNNSSALNYPHSLMTAQNTAVSQTFTAALGNFIIGSITGATGTASVFDPVYILITNYASATLYKSVQGQFACHADGTLANTFSGTIWGWWRQAAAISRIDLSILIGGNFVSGSKFELYGIR